MHPAPERSPSSTRRQRFAPSTSSLIGILGRGCKSLISRWLRGQPVTSQRPRAPQGRGKRAPGPVTCYAPAAALAELAGARSRRSPGCPVVRLAPRAGYREAGSKPAGVGRHHLVANPCLVVEGPDLPASSFLETRSAVVGPVAGRSWHARVLRTRGLRLGRARRGRRVLSRRYGGTAPALDDRLPNGGGPSRRSNGSLRPYLAFRNGGGFAMDDKAVGSRRLFLTTTAEGGAVTGRLRKGPQEQRAGRKSSTRG